MKRVKEGYRPEKPEHCDREIYNMMFYCWDKDPAERPSFTQLVMMMTIMMMMMFYCWDKDPAERPSFTQLVTQLLIVN